MIRPSLLRACAFAFLACPAVSLAAGTQGAQDDTSAAEPVARVGPAVVSAAELDAELQRPLAELKARHEAQLRRLDIQLEKGEQLLRERAAESLVDRRVLDIEARERAITPEALLASIPEHEPTAEEVQAFYAANAKQIGRPFPEVEIEIAAQLIARERAARQRALVDELRAKHGVSMLYEVRRYDVIGGGVSRGPADAPVTIVEFADFQCPFCARVSPVIERLLEDYAGRVRHVYRHFPLTSIHPQAYEAAVASVCADRQGRFWEFHKALLADQANMDAAAIESRAVQQAFDMGQFRSCVRDGSARAIVDADLAAAKPLPVEGTPSIFVNGRLFFGSLTIENFRRYVDDELARSTAKAAFAVR